MNRIFESCWMRETIQALFGLFCLLLVACGGSSADITGTGDDPDADQTASEEGEVQGYGSVIVNGTHYETSAETEITIDGQPASESQLALGMVVEVEVDAGDLGVDGSTARRIASRMRLEGRLDAIDEAASRLTVMGVTVVADQLTRIFDSSGDSLRLEDLAPGDVLQINGFRRRVGILASFVRRVATRETDFIMRGQVQDLDTSQLRFILNDVPVDYSAATVLEVSDRLENGDIVEVEGQPSAQHAEFKADRVSELRDAQAQPYQRGGVQGLVTSVHSDTTCPDLRFVVGERVVRVTSTTQIHNGSCMDIQVGRRIQTIGRFDEDGILVADRLAIAPELTAIVIAEVEEVSNTKSHAVLCSVRVLGNLYIDVNENTRQGASTQSGSRGFGCPDVVVGERILAVGAFDDSESPARIEAALLSAGPSFNSAPAEFQDLSVTAGQVLQIDPLMRTFQLLDTTIQITDSTDFGDSSEAEFYSQTREGDFVSAFGNWDGTVIQVLAVRREFDDDF